MVREVEVPGDALVLRFRPTTPESVLNWALKEFRYAGHYGLSVFADVRREDETEEDLILRLLAASEVAGVPPAGNPKFYVCSSAQMLYDQGFRFMKDEEEGELPEHYCVDLGNTEPDLSVVTSFVDVFEREEKR